MHIFIDFWKLETENSLLHVFSFLHKLNFENSFCFLPILSCQTSFLVLKIENYFWKQKIREKNSYQTYPHSSDIYSVLDYVSFLPRTSFKPWLTIRKLIKSPVLSSTLLWIYCIGPIGLITHFFWVWVTICVSTVVIVLKKW